ncbi:type II/IV secretion system ATPase subunit [Halomontanus rarus]|uniref:type II/IV secretion system ATPase subunit n=1 Tax=Halomontanus rarus TaxID=3034020 RepID=UPI0023E8AC45|nr:type II/IV secretion system ATPase subunit [Halovivax sp. TS33]
MASHNESTRGQNDDATDEHDDSSEPDDDSGGERTENAPDRRDGATETTLERVERIAGRVIDLLSGSQIDLENYDPSAHGTLFASDEESSFDDLEEVDRYWVDAPFSYITIAYDPERHRHEYHTVEPALREDEQVLLETLFADVRDPLLYRDHTTDDVETLLVETIHEHLERYGAEIDMPTFYRLLYYVHRDFRGYGRLEPVMHDPHVEDISCDGYDLPIFVYHDTYTDIQTNVSFAKSDLDRFVVRLAQHSGRHISIGDPMVETTLPDGSRAELALGEEVTPRGSAFTVRKYADDPFTPVDLLNYGTFSVDQLASLWLAIEHNKSLVFAGGTASGKTTSMNAISMFIPPRSKVLTIEDTRELQLYHDNWLSSVTRERVHEGTDVSMYDLLRSALRHRPEYIVVGEVRGEEAMTLFQAMNTGHTTYSTMHADSVQTAINRLENEPINVPRSMVQSLDILSVQTLTRLDDERVRRNQVIAEIEGIDSRTGELDYSTAYEWDSGTDTFEKTGSHVLQEIRDERGWSQDELLTELENRRTFLEYVRDRGIDDYRRFTALVNEYYADGAAVLEMIGESVDDPDGRDGNESNSRLNGDYAGADTDTESPTDTLESVSVSEFEFESEPDR